MRHLVMTAIAVTAIAVSAPIWAQPAPSTAPPPGANAPAAPVQPMNRMPAGGRATSERGATGSAAGQAQPSSSTALPPDVNTPAAPVQSMNRMPAGGRATSERGATGSVTRAHHRRHAVQSARASSDNTADQLNRQELSQLPGTGNPTTMNRMSVGGRATSGGPNQ
jgi:hypothetical protein